MDDYMEDIVELFRKENEKNKFLGNEEQVLDDLLAGKKAGGSELEQINARFIKWLCSLDPELLLKAFSEIVIQGVAITEGPLDLNFLKIPFSISLVNCSIPDKILLRHATIDALNLDGSRTDKIEADGLHVLGSISLAKDFRAEGGVCLIGAKIDGDLQCTSGKFGNQYHSLNSQENIGCINCRTRTTCNYGLVLERVTVKGSLYLCGDFTAWGGVNLGDSSISGNLNFTKAKLDARSFVSNDKKPKTGGRRLACNEDGSYHLACALNSEGMRIRGNLILNEIKCYGVVRLTGANISGDLESKEGKYYNESGNAIHGDRLRVGGNVFFCNKFEAKGVVRLNRSEIGADLSFYDGKITCCEKKSAALACKGMRAKGTVFFENFEAENCYINLTNSIIDGNLKCTNSAFKNSDSWAIKAKGMNIGGSVFLNTDKSVGQECGFSAEGLVCLTGSKVGMDLICTNGHFMSDKKIENEKYTPCAIKVDDVIIGGKVEMNGKNFIADGGVNFDDSKVNSYVEFDDGTFTHPKGDAEGERYAISAGKLHVGGSVYLEGIDARGQTMLNDASIGRNLIFDRGKISSEGQQYALQAKQVKVAGTIYMNEGFVSDGEIRLCRATIGANLDCKGGKFKKASGENDCSLRAALINVGGSVKFCGDKDGNPFISIGEINMDYAIIRGNLDCQNGEFINQRNEIYRQKEQTEKKFALRAVGVRIDGSALFKKHLVDGIVSFQGATIGREFVWKEIRKSVNVSLYLDSAKAGVLEDDSESWPSDNMLQINDFQYQFLKGLGAEELKRRREKWLAIPRDFRRQPYEHLSAVLNRSGYEEESKLVLIAKNNKQTDLPVRLGKDIIMNENPAQKGETQNLFTWTKMKLLKYLISYGYRPFRPLWIGLVLVSLGGIFFTLGFNNNLMVPIKNGPSQSFIYQIATISPHPESEQSDTVDSSVSSKSSPETQRESTDKNKLKRPKNLKPECWKYRIFYSLLYSLDTFLPVVNFQIANYWLPTAYNQIQQSNPNWWGVGLCFYRWFLIVMGWIVTTLILAALGGIVRR